MSPPGTFRDPFCPGDPLRFDRCHAKKSERICLDAAIGSIRCVARVREVDPAAVRSRAASWLAATTATTAGVVRLALGVAGRALRLPGSPGSGEHRT